MKNSKLLLCLPLAACALFGQAAIESRPNRAIPYPEAWPPGPDRSSVPAWAAPGKLRFARWDGGRIETAKAFLSGWDGMNPPDPDIVYTTTNWYDPSTIRLLKDAGINLIWVTLSVGFSNESEQAHREEVRKYISECHRHGVRVMAYESIGNMFWEDMFAVVPESKSWLRLDPNGKPTPYSAGSYQKMGRITRYMADLGNPGWRDYLLKRIDLAVESGADGLMYDNNFGDHLFDLYPKLVNHALSRKRDFLVMANFHADTYVLNRMVNCITTEDGLEPGLYSPSSPGFAGIKPHHNFLLRLNDKFLVNNVGLLRLHETLSEGWKPVMIEDGRREHEDRLTGLMRPARAQLAMAENMMYGIALEQFVEMRPAYELVSGKGRALETWRAIGKYNRFFAERQDLYTGARSKAPLTVILDDRSEGVPVLDGLASRGVLFNVLYERDVTPESLKGYRAAAVLTARFLRSSAVSSLQQFAQNGGKLLAAGGSVKLLPAATASYEKLPPLDELAKALIAASGAPLVELDAQPGVLVNMTEQADRKRVLVHVLNYALDPTSVALKIPGNYRAARLVSPDAGDVVVKTADLAGGAARLRIPQLAIYAVAVLERN